MADLLIGKELVCFRHFKILTTVLISKGKENTLATH